MDGVTPLEHLLQRIYQETSSSDGTKAIRLIAEHLTPQEFVEHLSSRGFHNLLDGRHERMRPSVERVLEKLGLKREGRSDATASQRPRRGIR